MNTYELAVLFHPDLEIDLDKATQKVTKIITDNSGKITADDNWGKRKLSYKIKGLSSAVYVFYTIELPPETVRKIEASLSITDEILRFLITKVDFKAIAKAEAVRAARAKKFASKEEAETKPTKKEVEINEEEE